MPDTTFLNWPFFEDAHREYAREIREWAAATIPGITEDEPRNNDQLDAQMRKLVTTIGAAGWFKACVPAAYGGTFESFDVRCLCIARETLGYYSGLADFAMAMQGLGTGSISLFGSDELKSRYLPPVAAGEKMAAFAISEKGAGSDVANMTTAAEADGNGWVINGEKTWISNAGIADHYVVFARTGEAEGARGISAFVVDADNSGLSVSERIDVIAPHPLGTLEFNDCRVEGSHRLGEGGDGFKIAMATLDVFRSTVGAAALGFARRAMDEAIGRAESRRAFGSAIAEFQLIQEKIADMAVAVDTTALLVYRSAWTKDTRETRVTRESAMAKLHATESAQQVIDQAVQIFGGEGVVSGRTVEKLYREIRALRIYEGTSEIQKLVIAGQARAAFRDD